VVAHELIVDHFLFRFHHMVAAQREILESDFLFYPIARAVKIALSKARKKKNRFAQEGTGSV